MSKTETANETIQKPKKMKGSTKALLIIVSLLMMAFLRTGFIFFVVGMMPSILFYIIDASKHRYTFQCVLACNLSGMMGFLLQMIAHGPSSAVLQEMMGSFTNWLIIYGAALMGWLVVQICPMLSEALVHNIHKGQIQRIQRIQKKLENEWGGEVAQLSHAADPNHRSDPQ